jgi:hypothetical protein
VRPTTGYYTGWGVTFGLRESADWSVMTGTYTDEDLFLVMLNNRLGRDTYNGLFSFRPAGMP